MTNKALRNLHIDLGLGSYTDLTSECIRYDQVLGLAPQSRSVTAVPTEVETSKQKKRKVGFNINI